MPKAPKPDVGRVLESLDRRLSSVEQILPTLATREELREAIAPLATREGMHSAIEAAVAPLATRDEVRGDGRDTRRHFDVVAESIRTEIRLIAEGHVHQTLRLDAFEAKTDRALAGLDRRVLRLEAKRSR